MLARRASSRLGPTLGRAGGARTARLGRLLGILGVLLALTGGRARSVYGCSRVRLVADYGGLGDTAATIGAVFEIGNSLREARLRRDSTSPRPSTARRSGRSTCARSRTSSSTCCPSQTYIKGFLRTYAEYLGLDGQLYVDEYNSRYVVGEEDAPLRSPRRVPAARPRATAGASRTSSCSP